MIRHLQSIREVEEAGSRLGGCLGMTSRHDGISTTISAASGAVLSQQDTLDTKRMFTRKCFRKAAPCYPAETDRGQEDHLYLTCTFQI